MKYIAIFLIVAGVCTLACAYLMFVATAAAITP